jgi:CHAT domain-containing protein
MILQSNLALQKAILGSKNHGLIANYYDLINIKKTLDHQETLTVEKRTLSTDSLENLANASEKHLLVEMLKYPELEKYSSFGETVSWKKIQNSLKPDEAAIEFISFKYHKKARWADSTYYCALVLCKEFKYPKMIFLCEERQLQSLLPNGSNNNWGINNLYNLNGTMTKDSDDYCLYKLIWQPIDTFLNGIKTIYLSPSGLLHKISFNALAMPDKRFLSDKYMLNTVSSTAEILKKQNSYKTSKLTNPCIYGGIRYDIPHDEMLKNSLSYNNNKDYNYLASNALLTYQKNRGGEWVYLPGTLDEAKNIDNLFKENNIKAKLITGAEANEESFKNLSGNGSPEIIHVATHGFFMPDPRKEYTELELQGASSFTSSKNALLRSGLLFAGAGAAWDKDTIQEGVEDGILTASEISQMYLPNTRLVVLSACETGLGEIKGGEGVFGLQRAFKMAGVDYILMSLWQVPDKQTSELMQTFYQQLLSGQTVREAFNSAQNQLKNQYRNDPFVWAAFVLIN